jgi:hypothetical protein
MSSNGNLLRLVTAALGPDAARTATDTLSIHPSFLEESGSRISRAVFSLALATVLFHDLLQRVPTAAAYVSDRRRAGERIVFDHGALRTVRFPDRNTGALPAGREAFTRILIPLGYANMGTYPLPRLRMTGRAYAHVDEPELIPQYFISELHVSEFSEDFQRTAWRVFGNSVDPLQDASKRALAEFAEQGWASFEASCSALPEIARAFGRWHQTPALADYQMLLKESNEAAWLATEGNAFNHATDRVADVEALARNEASLGRPIKDHIEVSASGRVRQTAYRADPVERTFVLEDGSQTVMKVPGSFYEFITRDEVRGRDGRVRLDLSFDSSNAQGIFTMTRAQGG